MTRASFRALWIVLASLAVAMLIAPVIQAQKQPPKKPIDLNVANAKELQQLPGIGPATAKRIIDMRTKSGRFRRVEDLLAIRGISEKKLEALRPYVIVSPPPPSPQKSLPAKKGNP